jgi:hypothetical protein
MYARHGTISGDHRRGYRDRRSVTLGWLRPEVVWTSAWRRQNRARKFFILLPGRHLHRHQRDSDTDFFVVQALAAKFYRRFRRSSAFVLATARQADAATVVTNAGDVEKASIDRSHRAPTTMPAVSADAINAGIGQAGG